MRLHIKKQGHDPRQVDLVAVIALIALVFGAICYYAAPSTTDQITTAFIVPSQTVHW